MSIESSESTDSFKIDYDHINEEVPEEKKPVLNPDLANLQNVNIFLQQLPYFDKVKANAFQAFKEIKKNIFESVAINEIRPGLVHWSNRFIIFMHEYGLFFTKEEHVQIIKLYLEIMLTPDVDLTTVDMCFDVLEELLKKFSKLSRKDLIIEWKPIYKLYLRIHKIDDFSSELAPGTIESAGFMGFIRYARIYFDVNATKEMLEVWRNLMCPFDSEMNTAFERFKLFLPTLLYDYEDEYGYKLWLVEFLNLWTTFNTRHFWELHLLSLFSRLSNDIIGEFDWNPYIPYIFSNILRGFGLPFGSKDSITLGISGSTSASINNNMSQIFVYSNDCVLTIASWIVSMIGCGENRDMCMEHIKKLFEALRSFYYPSNTGSWSANLFLFLKALPDFLIKRIKKEKREKNKWYNRRQNPNVFINDKDITSFVNALKDIVFTAIFSKSNHSEAKKAFQYLTFLSGDLMFPPLIEKVNLSLESLVEPHRYTSILSCLVSVSRELATFNPNNLVQTQIHVIPLLCAVLPGLDPNDSHKCILTMQFISNVLSCLIVCDCSSAPNYRIDLTDLEKELCFETSKFEDFVHEFFTRIFRIIDNLASDTSSDSSASAAAASSYFAVNGRVKNTDENAYQAHMIQTIRILIRQSSKPFLKLILNKLKNFIDGNSYNIRSGRIVASICGFLAASGYGRESFEILFKYVYENLCKFKESKSYEQFLKDERGDIEVTWNLQLLAELMKASGIILTEHINRITQLITWYRPVVNKESIGYISCCFRNVIVSLTNVSSNDLCSVTYNIIFDDEKEFFTNHLPIRDWARNGDIFDLNIKYHLPSVKEIEVALDFVETFLKQCTEFVSETILSSKNDDGLSASSKEERNRELNYINHLIYGASRLLKRTSKHAYVTEHIGSKIEIGLSDDLNKGLGFEIANMNDPNHEYSKLSAHHRELILTTREKIIEFIIQLGEKLIEKHPNETTLLMLVARILATASVTYGYFTHDFEKMWKNHYANKASLQNKLLGKQNSLREELIQRILLQYQFRTFHIHTKINTLDIRIIDILFKLSTDSLYAVVRKDAQTQLFTVMSQYPYSNLIIVPKIVEMLNRSSLLDTDKNKLTHDQLKGCLYLLRGNNIQDSLMIKQNWSVIGTIWPAFLKCQDFEKPSIQALLDKIYFKANKDYDSFDNRIELTQKCLSLVYEFCPELKVKYEYNGLRKKIFNERVLMENDLIEKFMTDLVKIATEPKLLWKNQVIRYVAFLFILNSCVLEKRLLTPECVQLFVDSLVHENITVRKIAIDSLCIILKMVKFKKELITYDTVNLIKEQSNNLVSNDDLRDITKPNPGYRPDNKWHFYNPNFINTNIDPSTNDNDKCIWSRAKFLDKSFWGYYCWPEKIDIVSNKRANFNTHTNEYTEAVKIIREKFQNDSNFVKKFIKFSIIEESKGNEKFDKKKFYFFKALFRNFGSTEIFHNFYENLVLLINDKQNQTQECSHKLASEMISGVIRGSKYWSLDDLKVLWSKLKPIFDLIIDNISTENLKLWYNCFSTAYEDQDPRRLTFYINYFLDLTRRFFINKQISSDTEASKSTSFQQTSCLHLLNALGQCEWKAPEFWSCLFETFMSNMNHPYKSVREKIALCITSCLIKEIDYSTSIERSKNKLHIKPTKLESLNKFISFLEVKLNQAIELFDFVSEDNIDSNSNSNEKEKKNYNTSQHLDAVNFLQTTFSLFGFYLLKSYQPINPELIRIIPQLCSVDKIAAQEVTVKAQLPVMRMVFSMWMLDEKCSYLLLDQIQKVIKFKSWHSRLAAIQMLQSFGIFNLFLVNDTVKSLIKEIILSSLIDEQLEVRLSACLTLTGFIHSNFFYVDENLIDHLKKLSRIKPRVKEIESGKMVTSMPNIIKRHGGVLGLCSIVNSCPYDVPSYLPDTVTYLCQYTNDPVPIQSSVRKCLSEFRRTHHDNWQEHKLNFNESQLSILTDILISPNYYA